MAITQKTVFGEYGARADASIPETNRNGRYMVQKEAEKLVAPDIMEKLNLGPEDTLLDIGCGAGVVIKALHTKVARATGIDHPKTIKLLQESFREKEVTLLAGEFPNLELNQKYSAIVAYSVLHCLPSMDHVDRFIDAAARTLSPGGRLLLGDIPNKDRKARFLRSAAGVAFQSTWVEEQAKAADVISPPGAGLESPVFSDTAVLRIIERMRRDGFEAFVLPQNPGLPFGNSREDILVIRHD